MIRHNDLMNQVKNIDAILAELKKSGAMTSGELAKILDMTSMGARQHLLRLEKQELVSTYSQKADVGRPKLLWQLTAKAHGQFPDRHADLTLHLIDSVKVIYGESGLNKLIASREQKISDQYQQALLLCNDLPSKVASLAYLRNQEGYMATVERVSDDEYLLIENHCPICSAAKICQNFCRSELEIFQQSFGENYHVERCEYLLEGDRRCSYRIICKIM
jgi:predicted ArsR family transcriptional regulator